ncbi:MAG: hypothetical protein G01um101418_750 [Parcubacteria group bacterium Gr01-1014_18]|nr:MAG: hypothetical protein Greene041636_740 [Parcubacteria group bacterium Greene0416_36]TSC80242.1 MAG: hypothetical protein G01um101418_750 [Parcubacteria group bacterium Gr01-1014_18]TSC98424.1 MAG: hypothetical protein Greene101420_777 [Parcubacteria group bacterium Greene1014_20]TSD06965.1 MAG: hypothetical protein Greene07142_528 [Parcubacteria group bacterium Greene0714_2]
MPIKENARKAMRQSETRYVRNQKAKSQIEYLRRMAKKYADAKDKKNLAESGAKLVKAIDKAKAKGMLKANTAARQKSSAMRLVNTVK